MQLTPLIPLTPLMQLMQLMQLMPLMLKAATGAVSAHPSPAWKPSSRRHCGPSSSAAVSASLPCATST